MTKGYTKISNETLIDSNLSFEAIGLYSLISYYSNIPGFKLNKSHIQAVARSHDMGETKFNRVWKELKDKGFLIQEKKCIGGKFEYAYSLANAIVQKAVEKVKKVLDKDKTKEEKIFVIDGLKHSEIKELIDLCGDESKAREYIEYSKKMSPSNLFRYAKNAIIKRFDINKHSGKGGKTLIFTDYEQREYDFNKLENALLYGDSYDLPV